MKLKLLNDLYGVNIRRPFPTIELIVVIVLTIGIIIGIWNAI